jgi:hypothetical protein
MDKAFKDYEEFESLIYAKFICGCGDPNSVMELVKKYLEILKEYEDSRVPTTLGYAAFLSSEAYENYKQGKEAIFNNVPEPFQYLLMYDCDRLGFTEHGSAVNSAWITKKGREAIEYITEFIEEN